MFFKALGAILRVAGGKLFLTSGLNIKPGIRVILNTAMAIIKIAADILIDLFTVV